MAINKEALDAFANAIENMKFRDFRGFFAIYASENIKKVRKEAIKWEKSGYYIKIADFKRHPLLDYYVLYVYKQGELLI